ncbi:flavin-dependent oxidoreductase [Shimia sagamensis]|uniref:2-polyprenyl-6-methoxyphenol hydroxylase n=1 Tax=Shimia sagamensis TaxID=1566352 RepID=A0ABY1NYR6_9RHOB|nr:flavin-dependent oxidoreductase [Shimia sagamensis]SMP20503.1 2-polyprenyl-6-methoxyphenol hydroxylase [Shimia sagamensis]
MTVIIAGGGIAGLTMGLTLHEIGVPFHILESVTAPKPLGVGINLQPPCVRELFALGLEDMLEHVGVRTRDYGFYTKTGVEIWTEPRGRHAGYNWPQYSVHRGELQMGLLDALIARCGADSISFGCRVTGYTNTKSGVTATYQQNATTKSLSGTLLVAADGVHSAIRAQMYPEEGAPVWGGAIMWRGTTTAPAFLSGTSMILAGHDTQRFVTYPISAPNPETGDMLINWIAEASVDPNTHIQKGDWNRKVDAARFADDFTNWDFGWINIPELIANANEVFEYPMVDREPVESWTDGAVTLIGDAAHATYPVGSSGASQAIIDARLLGAAIKAHGTGHTAAKTYENQVRPMANAITLANRGNGGPDAIMQMAEDRCAGDFTRLDEVLPMQERRDHADGFKKLARIRVEDTNTQAPIIA